jgi:hypothetical protein
MSRFAFTAKMTRICRARIDGILLRAMLLSSLAVTGRAGAQEVIAPHPELPTLPPVLEEIETNKTSVIPPGQSVPPAVTESPFQYGPLTLRPHFDYRFLYGSGIQSSPGQPQKSVTQDISPGLLLAVGSHWTLDYTPTWTVYSNRRFRDTLDHDVKLIGGTTYGDWVLGLSQSYARDSSPLTETGQQTDQETYSTAANASYRFGQQMSMDLAGNQDFKFTQNLPSSREWSTLDWLNYQFWPRLDAGLGLGLGYTDVSSGTDQAYEQYQARINWRATDKLSLHLHGGVEDRQLLASGKPDLINPIYGASVQYQPLDVTTISLSVDRAVNASIFTNQITETTTVNGTLNQRLLERFYLDLHGEYQITTYTAAANGVLAGRRDEYYSINVRLSTTFLKRGTVATFYQYSGNSSNRSGFGYSSSQVGLELGYRY